MPRELEDIERIELPLYNPLTQETTTLYYRAPSNAERVQYEAACVKGKGMKAKFAPGEAQLKYGAKLLTGIKDGDFTKGGKPISSDPDSEHYLEGWKKLVVEVAGDLIKGLSAHAFSIAIIGDPSDGEEDEEEDVSFTLEDQDSEDALDKENPEEGKAGSPLE